MTNSTQSTKIIPLVYATNDNYAPYTDVSIQSIVRNLEEDRVLDIYVFHTQLSPRSIELLQSNQGDNYRVTCLDVSPWLEQHGDLLYSHTYFSVEMYYRILIADVLPQYDKVIYVDGDTVVLDDVSHLYDLDIGDNYLGACRNVMHPKMQAYVRDKLGLDPARYINSGILVINTRAFREDKVALRIFEEIPRHDTLTYPDQDLINLVCSGHIHYLPLEWNFLWHIERLNQAQDPILHVIPEDMEEYLQASEHVRILHFTGDKKPWHFDAIPRAEHFWEYAQSSPFLPQLKQAFLRANAKCKKTKFELLKVAQKSLFFTCSVFDFEKTSSAPFGVNCDGSFIRSKPLNTARIKQGGVWLYKHVYRFEFKLSALNPNGSRIYLTHGGQSVMFEYGKFFPLNGLNKSFFCYNHRFILRRQDKYLFIYRYTLGRRLKAELAYDRQLLKGNRLHRKSLLARWLYYLTRPFTHKNIWLFSDRPSVAGDNGEALFRYVATECRHDYIRPYFVIEKDSPDYARLKKVGRVVPMRSFAHKYLTMHANGIAVSQTDFPLFFVFEENFVKDITYKRKKVFLQHGITKDDVSQLYSRYTHDFQLFVTAAHPEYDSILQNPNYGMDANIVKLTGFPRHDRLVNDPQKVLVVTPTWRKKLLVDMATKQLRANFEESSYYRFYHDLLSHPALREEAKRQGYKILFVPHDLMEESIPFFEDIPDVTILGSKDRSYAELFSQGALLVTDYSSNAFEFALLRKPVIYTQFDREDFFEGHTYDKGYFDYERDGFGQVAQDVEETVEIILEYLRHDCAILPEYRERIDRFYAFDNHGNCQRVYKEMWKLK